jgi:hypothetical protein
MRYQLYMQLSVKNSECWCEGNDVPYKQKKAQHAYLWDPEQGVRKTTILDNNNTSRAWFHDSCLKKMEILCDTDKNGELWKRTVPKNWQYTRVRSL